MTYRTESQWLICQQIMLHKNQAAVRFIFFRIFIIFACSNYVIKDYFLHVSGTQTCSIQENVIRPGHCLSVQHQSTFSAVSHLILSSYFKPTKKIQKINLTHQLDLFALIYSKCCTPTIYTYNQNCIIILTVLNFLTYDFFLI